MRYYIAIDLGEFYNNKERYKKIDLTKLGNELNNNSLSSNNNLKYLCTFTMGFKSEKELKIFLKSKGLISNLYSNNNLCIVYSYKDSYRRIAIPFKSQEAYFNYAILPNLIKQKIYEQNNFLLSLIEFYKARKYSPEGYYYLYNILNGSLNDQQVFEIVRKFVYDVCYKEGRFSYFKFYELATFVAKFNKLDVNSKEDEAKEKKLTNNLKWENLEDRREKEQDLQLRLF